MFGRISLFFLVLNLMACARPNYQDLAKPDLKQKTDVSCDARKHLCFQMSWVTEPAVANAVFQFELNRDGDPEALGGEVQVKLWMPGMNHGSSPVTVEKISHGVYRATRVNFIMPGEWEIRIQILNEGRVIDELIQNIAI
jgi:nitrogen fixation protein FixH